MSTADRRNNTLKIVIDFGDHDPKVYSDRIKRVLRKATNFLPEVTDTIVYDEDGEENL